MKTTLTETEFEIWLVQGRDQSAAQLHAWPWQKSTSDKAAMERAQELAQNPPPGFTDGSWDVVVVNKGGDELFAVRAQKKQRSEK